MNTETSSETDPDQMKEITIREAIRLALREELERDDDVFVMGEDVGKLGGVHEVTGDLVEQFGETCTRDTPTSEAGFMGAVVGAAVTGTRPVVEIMFSDFIGVCSEQTINQMAKNRHMFGGKTEMSVTVRATGGGGSGATSQHFGTTHTWFAHFPGVMVVAPAMPASAKGLLKSAIRSDDPVIAFENKQIYEQKGKVPLDENFTTPIGTASAECEGEDMTVVATQHMIGESLELAEELAGQTSVEVIDLRSLYPMDTDTLVESVGKTGRPVIADESPLSCGTRAEMATRVMENAFYSLDAPIQRAGVADVHIPFSLAPEEEVLLNGSDVEAAINRIV